MHKLRQEFSAIKFLEKKAPEPEKWSAPVLIRFLQRVGPSDQCAQVDIVVARSLNRIVCLRVKVTI